MICLPTFAIKKSTVAHKRVNIPKYIYIDFGGYFLNLWHIFPWQVPTYKTSERRKSRVAGDLVWLHEGGNEDK